jgi:1-acyl-sn-glycerol-3-phosphate acyltransferase
MSEGARIVRERGISVLLFSEGGRSAEGLRDFKGGAAYIAIKAGVPVVPIAIIGMRELLPQGSVHLRSGKVKVRVGDPISTVGMTIKDRDELTERLQRNVASLLGLAAQVTPAAPAHPSVSGSL